LNLDIFRLRLIESNQTFIRHFSVHPTSISLHTKSQIRLYNDLADKDMIYFEVTGSLLRRQKNGNDYQIYTILVRNSQQWGVSLPVANNVATSRDSVSISHFIEKFHVDQVMECGKAKKNSFMIIDGSAAVWNGVLKAMCGETRLEYYWRCFRKVIGEPASGDLGKTIVYNCYSHSMKAAGILYNKYYGANV